MEDSRELFRRYFGQGNVFCLDSQFSCFVYFCTYSNEKAPWSCLPADSFSWIVWKKRNIVWKNDFLDLAVLISSVNVTFVSRIRFLSSPLFLRQKTHDAHQPLAHAPIYSKGPLANCGLSIFLKKIISHSFIHLPFNLWTFFYEWELLESHLMNFHLPSFSVPSMLHNVEMFYLPEVLALTDYKHSSLFTGGACFGKTARSLNDKNHSDQTFNRYNFPKFQIYYSGYSLPVGAAWSMVRQPHIRVCILTWYPNSKRLQSSTAVVLVFGFPRWGGVLIFESCIN